MSETPSERLISALERGGREGEAGAWSLDEEGARRKLAAYRLADPRVWLSTVVEAATLLGAGSVVIERGIGELRIGFDAAVPGLERLFGAVLAGSSGTAPQRAARKLAIAFETMLERADVNSIVVVSEGGRLTLSDTQNRFERADPAQPERTLIIAQRGTRWPEIEALARRARYSRASISAAKRVGSAPEPISFGLEQALSDAEATQARREIHDGEQRIGWIGRRPNTDLDSTLLLVSDGVVVEELALPGKGEVAIVACSLPKDLAENKLLRNAEFDRLFALVVAATAPARPSPTPTQTGPLRGLVARHLTRALIDPILLVLTVISILFGVVVIRPLCSPDAPGRDPRVVALRDALGRSETFASCDLDSLPGGELTQLRMQVVVTGTDLEARRALGYLVELNGTADLAEHAAVARCIEARVATLADELARERTDAWARTNEQVLDWTFEY